MMLPCPRQCHLRPRHPTFALPPAPPGGGGRWRKDDYAAVLQFPAMFSGGKEERAFTAGFGADSASICRGAGRPSALPSPANTAIGVYTFVGARQRPAVAWRAAKVRVPRCAGRVQAFICDSNSAEENASVRADACTARRRHVEVCVRLALLRSAQCVFWLMQRRASTPVSAMASQAAGKYVLLLSAAALVHLAAGKLSAALCMIS